MHKSTIIILNIVSNYFERVSPFDENFIPYYQGTLIWTIQHLSEVSANNLKKWMEADALMKIAIL